jgi:hypothetical protein
LVQKLQFPRQQQYFKSTVSSHYPSNHLTLTHTAFHVRDEINA